MKVWVLNYVEFGNVSVWHADTDPLKIRAVEDELSYLDNDFYRAEHDGFIDDVKRARDLGSGTAEIEERLHITLMGVRRAD